MWIMQEVSGEPRRVIHIRKSAHAGGRLGTRAVPSRKSRKVQGFFDNDSPGLRYFWNKQRCPDAQAPVRRSHGSVRVCPCYRTHPGLDMTDSSWL